MNIYNEQSFTYIALDKNLQEIADISHLVESGGTIEYNSLTTLKANCNLPISLGIDEQLDLDGVRVYMTLNGTKSCLGTFLIANPTSKFESCVQSMDLTGYSTLWRLSVNSPSGKYFVAKGTNAIAEIKRILISLGYAFDIPDCEKTTSIDREFDYGTSYLDMINELLEVVNYTSLYCDVYGKYHASAYVLPHERDIDWNIEEENIEIEQTSDLDRFNIPNKFIRWCSSSPSVSLYAEYEQTYGETGTNNTWTQVDAQEVTDVADYDTLYEICKKACCEANSKYHKLTISTVIQPIPTYMATIYLKHYQSEGKYTCTSFTMQLETGGSQEMNLRRTITIV